MFCRLFCWVELNFFTKKKKQKREVFFAHHGPKRRIDCVDGVCAPLGFNPKRGEWVLSEQQRADVNFVPFFATLFEVYLGRVSQCTIPESCLADPVSHNPGRDVSHGFPLLISTMGFFSGDSTRHRGIRKKAIEAYWEELQGQEKVDPTCLTIRWMIGDGPWW